jgi:hypothetical protein
MSGCLLHSHSRSFSGADKRPVLWTNRSNETDSLQVIHLKMSSQLFKLNWIFFPGVPTYLPTWSQNYRSCVKANFRLVSLLEAQWFYILEIKINDQVFSEMPPAHQVDNTKMRLAFLLGEACNTDLFLFVLVLFFQCWGWNLGPCACKGNILTEIHSQFLVFWRRFSLCCQGWPWTQDPLPSGFWYHRPAPPPQL